MALGHERFENVLQPHFGGISTFAIASPDAVIIIGGGIFLLESGTFARPYIYY